MPYSNRKPSPNAEEQRRSANHLYRLGSNCRVSCTQRRSASGQAAGDVCIGIDAAIPNLRVSTLNLEVQNIMHVFVASSRPYRHRSKRTQRGVTATYILPRLMKPHTKKYKLPIKKCAITGEGLRHEGSVAVEAMSRWRPMCVVEVSMETMGVNLKTCRTGVNPKVEISMETVGVNPKTCRGHRVPGYTGSSLPTT